MAKASTIASGHWAVCAGIGQ